MTNKPPQSLPSDRDHQQVHAERTSNNPNLIHPLAATLNAQHAALNNDIAVSFSSNPQIQFRTHTIAPSPPLSDPSSNSPPSASSSGQRQNPSPLSSGNTLRIQTDSHPSSIRTELHNSLATLASSRPGLGGVQRKVSSSSLRPVSRTPSFKKAIANTIGTASAASSCYPSPIITAMGDVTPLPSPLLSSDSPGPWNRHGPRSPTRENAPLVSPDSVLVSAAGESIASALANASKRKVYAGLLAAEDPDGTGAPPGHDHKQQHGRNRSISEYIPDPMLIPRRQITVSGSHLKPLDTSESTLEPHIRRELNLAESRGLTPTVTQPPTPPPSESSRDTGDSAAVSKPKPSRYEHFEAYGRHDRKRRRWRALKLLGQGTFSRVMLATSQMSSEEDDYPTTLQSGALTPISDKTQPDRKTLVAVKVCEHGPRGGASEDRIEMSLKRELELLQSIHHPSLVDLKAWNIEPTRAILVLSYCPGGDLFDVATSHRDLLVPALLRRMFAELVGAVQYLHERRIVHRDIKLENVLVNLPASELADASTDWATYPHSIITLTDLGLSRRIADDEKLETRCGSDDYAAPEVIMGQPYDGRATDAWSLGVLLYALLETRLPFDPNPGMSDAHRMRSRTSHRIARVEWRWIEYAGEDGDHEGSIAKFEEKGLLGAMEITEGLLKRARSRWGMDKVLGIEWVKGAIQVEGGIRFREEKEGEEVLSPQGQ